MFSGHFLCSKGKHNGNDRAKGFRNSCNSQCYSEKECFSHRFSPEYTDPKQNPAENQNDHRKFLAKLIQIYLQRCFFIRCRFQHRSNLPNFCFHTNIGYKKRSPSIGNKTSGIYHIGSVSKRYLSFNGIFCLIHPKTFSCKCTFIYLQTGIFKNSSICRDIISCLQTDNITNRYFRRRDFDNIPISQYFCFRPCHRFQTVQRLLCFYSLYSSKNCVHGDHYKNNNGTFHFTQNSGNHSCHYQNHDQKIFVLFKKNLKN